LFRLMMPEEAHAAPKVEGKEAVGAKDAPALYFGTHDGHSRRQAWRRIHPCRD